MAFRRRRRFGRFRRRRLFRHAGFRRFGGLHRAVNRAGRAGHYMVKETLNWGQDNNAVGGGSNNFVVANTATGSFSNNAANLGFNMISGSGGTQCYASFGYQFNISNTGALAGLAIRFEWYRIRKVVLRLIPYATVANTDSVGGVQNSNCILHSWIDPNTSTAPAASEVGIALGQNFQSYRTHRMVGSGFSRAIKPKMVTAIEQPGGGTASAAQSGRGQWCSCSSLQSVYFALRGVMEGIQPSANNSSIVMRAEITYYVEFKTPR